MKSLVIHVALLAVLGGIMTEAAHADRILRKDAVVNAPVVDIWHAWTTADGLEFISAKSNVELVVGGAYEWFLDLEPDARGKRGGEGARILSFVPEEVLSFSWSFPPSIPSLRDADAFTAVIVRFEPLEDGTTRVHFAQMGWGDGEDWDAGYAYFDRAWDVVLERLVEAFDGSN